MSDESRKVNQAKSAVDRPWKRKFLGFRDYLSEEANENGRANKRTEPVPCRMVRLLLASGHAEYLSKHGLMDKKKATHVPLETMEET
jgi:hypothetical protein